jgi:hypothetical protein
MTSTCIAREDQNFMNYQNSVARETDKLVYDRKMVIGVVIVFGVM